MLFLIFGILMIYVFITLLITAVKMTWSLTKIFLRVILFPIILIGMVVSGLIYLAIPILIVAAIFGTVGAVARI